MIELESLTPESGSSYSGSACGSPVLSFEHTWVILVPRAHAAEELGYKASQPEVRVLACPYSPKAGHQAHKTAEKTEFTPFGP